jgi:hypothetical protein
VPIPANQLVDLLPKCLLASIFQFAVLSEPFSNHEASNLRIVANRCTGPAEIEQREWAFDRLS